MRSQKSLCLQRGPATFKGRREGSQHPVLSPGPRPRLCQWFLGICLHSRKNTKERNLFSLLDVCFLSFPGDLRELRKSTHTHVHTHTHSFLFLPAKWGSSGHPSLYVSTQPLKQAVDEACGCRQNSGCPLDDNSNQVSPPLLGRASRIFSHLCDWGILLWPGREGT